MVTEEKSYEELVAELERIIIEIEDPAKSLSDVEADVRRGVELIDLCKGKLFESESRIMRFLEEK